MREKGEYKAKKEQETDSEHEMVELAHDRSPACARVSGPGSQEQPGTGENAHDLGVTIHIGLGSSEPEGPIELSEKAGPVGLLLGMGVIGASDGNGNSLIDASDGISRDMESRLRT